MSPSSEESSGANLRIRSKPQTRIKTPKMADSSRQPLLPTSPVLDSQPPPLPVDIDTIFRILGGTFFNPLFALFIPLTVLTTDPRLDAKPFLWSCAYSGAVILGGESGWH